MDAGTLVQHKFDAVVSVVAAARRLVVGLHGLGDDHDYEEDPYFDLTDEKADDKVSKHVACVRRLDVLHASLAAQQLRFLLEATPLQLRVGDERARSELERVAHVGEYATAADAAVLAVHRVLRDAGVCVSDAVKKARRTDAAERKEQDMPRVLVSVRSGARAGTHQLCVGVQKALDAYPTHAGATTATADTDYQRCEMCAATMLVDPEHSEVRCAHCGITRELGGVVFDAMQFYSQEGQKAKSGAFNPHRHLQFWWTHIYAQEPEEELGDAKDESNQCGEKLIAQLREMVRRDHKVLLHLTPYDVRDLLQKTGNTVLNKNVALLLKKLTGVGPPTPSEELAHKVTKLFLAAVEYSEKVRPASRTNRNYYPYYIYKILEAILTEPEQRRVLYYIYLQSDDTLERNDASWRDICMSPDMAEVKYKPTCKRDAAKYRPA